MGATSDAKATVLVVDDEPEVADAYSKLLATEYEVRTAYGGEAALEEVDEDVDVVLLDRRMPELSGDDVLAEVRERDLDVRVVMVTAVDPGFDILDMQFDDYLCKPVDAATLRDAVEQQLRAASYDDQLDEFFEVTAKMGVLEARRLPGELEDDEEYRELEDKADDLQDDLSEIVDEFDDIAHAFNDIDRV
jgi:DNA-binding response OmpR family regulator